MGGCLRIYGRLTTIHLDSSVETGAGISHTIVPNNAWVENETKKRYGSHSQNEYAQTTIKPALRAGLETSLRSPILEIKYLLKRFI